MLIHEVYHEVIGGFRKSCKQHLQICTVLPNYVLLTVRTENSLKNYLDQVLCTPADDIISLAHGISIAHAMSKAHGMSIAHTMSLYHDFSGL